jgi:uncharacterized protein YdeI (YjbR/CyaY-like superfamily)
LTITSAEPADNWQREYADYIASAKRAETKNARIEKILPKIAAGAGFHDKYRTN